MESRLPRSVAGRALVLTIAVVSVVASGCAIIGRSEARGTEDLLLAAGFQPRPADTPEKTAQLKSLPALKMMEVRLKDGNAVYTYADPDNCNCLYMGGPKQYENFRHLVSQQQASEKQAALVQAEEGEALTFGTWGGW